MRTGRPRFVLQSGCYGFSKQQCGARPWPAHDEFPTWMQTARGQATGFLSS